MPVPIRTTVAPKISPPKFNPKVPDQTHYNSDRDSIVGAVTSIAAQQEQQSAALAALSLRSAGTVGPAGPPGAQGPPGPAGSSVPSGLAGGSLAGNYPNPSIRDSGVVAGTYGDDVTVPQIEVGVDGRVISVTDIPITFPAGGSTSPGYIDGCYLKFASTTTITIITGAYYHPGSSALVTVLSPVTITPTIGASTLYYVYGDGAGAFVASSTAPTSNYLGTAWKNGSNDRYIGSFLTDGSSHIINFRRSGNYVAYKADTTIAPLLVVSASALVVTSKSLTGIVPATCFLAKMVVNLTATGSGQVSASFGTSDGLTPTATAGDPYVQTDTAFGGPTNYGSYDIPLNASQAFTYINAFTTNGMLLQLMGYFEDR